MKTQQKRTIGLLTKKFDVCGCTRNFLDNAHGDRPKVMEHIRVTIANSILLRDLSLRLMKHALQATASPVDVFLLGFRYGGTLGIYTERDFKKRSLDEYDPMTALRGFFQRTHDDWMATINEVHNGMKGCKPLKQLVTETIAEAMGVANPTQILQMGVWYGIVIGIYMERERRKIQ